LGKTALITGAGKRLGRETALALAQAGVNTVIHYNRSADAAESAANEVRSLGVRAWTVRADLAEPEDANELLPRLPADVPSLDILINNASIFDEARFGDLDYRSLDLNMRINALAPALIGRVFASQIRKTGHIVNFLDCRIVDYDNTHVPYHLSKRLFADLTRMMAVEFAPQIQVNAVAPGLILPPEGKDERYLKGLAHTNPLNRYGGPNDITDAMLFLLRSDFITGQVIYVDGGRNLRGNMYG
jgi:NAD(P)-dependent dehydrogenase (short-subunit alcohol dehydrogenase family)